MQPPERIGNVKLSSRFPRSVPFPKKSDRNHNEGKEDVPRASAMPVTRPETMLITAKPTQPPVGKPEKPASRNTAFTLCPMGLWSTPGPVTPSVQSQVGSGPPTAGTSQLQREKTITAPVIEAARNPARDLRGANGRPRIGTREGSGRVWRPHKRPNVEAAVSAQERLLRRSKVKQGKTVGWMLTYIRTDTSATSKGYCESTKTTPRMYHITPLVCFCKIRKMDGRCQMTFGSEQT